MGLTNRLQTSFYLNLSAQTSESMGVRSSAIEFQGVSSEWKYKTGMYCASRAERCAGVTLFSCRDPASAAAAHKTAANPSATRMPRHLVRDFDIDASVAGRPWQRGVVQRLRTGDCLAVMFSASLTRGAVKRRSEPPFGRWINRSAPAIDEV